MEHGPCCSTAPAGPRGGDSRVSQAWPLQGPLFPAASCSSETLIRHRCVVQPQAVTSTRNQVSRTYVVPTFHSRFFGRSSHLRTASVYPLDTGGLRRRLDTPWVCGSDAAPWLSYARSLGTPEKSYSDSMRVRSWEPKRSRRTGARLVLASTVRC
jgi:hypothetical protein